MLGEGRHGSSEGSEGMKAKRLFIVAPTAAGEAVGDSLHVVCSTASRGSFLDAYQQDDYEELASFGSLKGAVGSCKRRGAKRPFVLA